MKKLLLLTCLTLGISASAQREIKDTLMGLHDHQSDINAATYSLDGRRLLSGGMDRQVIYYDAINWFPIYQYSHYDEVTHLAISRDNAMIASAAKDKSIKVYMMDSAKTLEFSQAADITGLCFDYALRNVYTAGSDGVIRIFDLRRGEEMKKNFPQGMPVTALSISHNGFLFAGMQNGEIRVLNTMGKQTQVLKGHNAAITTLHYVFFKNAAYLASGSEDKTIKIWDTRTWKEHKTLTGHTWTINSVEMSRDLKYVVSAGKDGMSRVWDLTNGAVIADIPSKGESVACISISGDNKYIATTALVRDRKEYIIYIWNSGLVEDPKPTPPEKPKPEKGKPGTPAPEKKPDNNKPKGTTPPKSK